MSDIIRLLPDAVANQIAAGEVVQRPASAVKELLENAIDAGATDIQLIIKDAGKTLIQVIDNGCGMTDTDARLSFERHATSKLREASDLFSIKTMGFRGEALASIAAIAQVELKTRQGNTELGTRIEIIGSEIKAQESCQCPVGTSIAVKNLFYNVPARRQFLKSDSVEKKHISEEFYRVALIHPEVKFSFYVDDKAEIVVEKSTLKQRIVNIYGTSYNQKLIPIEQSITGLSITGFVGKPEYALKSRSEQYFFVNKRFIKHPYLHHAVDAAFQELLPEKNYPSYFIHFDIDPKNIDINIHPTKTEIKFADEKLMYGVLRSTVRKAIGKHNITPSLDFGPASDYEIMPPPSDYVPLVPKINVNTNYNPFEQKQSGSSGNSAAFHTDYKKPVQAITPSYINNYSKLYEEPTPSTDEPTNKGKIQPIAAGETAFLWQNKYIVTHLKSGLLVMDYALAHERILFEQFNKTLNSQTETVQHKLFPQTIELSGADAEVLQEINDDLTLMGWQIESFGQKTFIIHAMPEDMNEDEVKSTLEHIIGQYKQSLLTFRDSKKAHLAAALAKQKALKTGQTLQPEEIQYIINALFACELPTVTPSGKSIFTVISADEVTKRLEKS